MAPLIDDDAPGQYRPQTLAGTGTTESVNPRPFSKDRAHVLVVGPVDVRVGFSRDGTLSNAIPATGGMIVPAGKVLPFRAFDSGKFGALFVYVEAADGSSAYEVSVQQRER